MTNAVLLSLAVLLPAQAEPSPDAAKLKAAHDQAQACAEATVKGDYEKLADLTNPAAIEAMGGRASMIAKVKDGLAEMKKEGVHLVSSRATAPEAIHAVDSDLYTIVPTSLIIQTKQGKIRSRSYLLGHSSDDGKTWKFIDGSPGEPQIRKLLPNLPKVMRFPNKEKPQRVPDSTK